MNKFICPNCGEVQSAYWGQCLKCGAMLKSIPIKKEVDDATH